MCEYFISTTYLFLLMGMTLRPLMEGDPWPQVNKVFLIMLL